MKDKIINAAIKLILNYGFRGFTMDDLCKSLNMSKKTIYKYFDSKNELLEAVIDLHINNDKQKTIQALNEAATITDKLKAIIMYYYDYRVPLELIEELKLYFPDLWKRLNDLWMFKQQLFKNTLLEAINSNEIRSNFNIDVLMLIIEKTIPTLTDYEFLTKHDVSNMTANKMLNEFTDIIFKGIF